MRSSVLIILLTFFSLNLYSQTDEILISRKFSDIPFMSFAETLEKEHNIRFFFKDDWVKGITVNGTYNNKLLSELLEEILSGTDLFAYIDQMGNIIITKEYAIKSRLYSDNKSDTNYIEFETETGQADSQNGSDYSIFTIGSPSGDNSGNVTLSGYVTNQNTGEAVPGAVFNIDELQRGAMTNQYGYYNITLPKGTYNVNFSCLGMKSTSRQLSIWESGSMDIEMKEKLIPLGSITVKAEGNAGLNRMEVGLERLNIKTVQLLPVNMGEADIIKTAILLPGIQTVGEGSSGFNVRGGSTDQNLVLLYDVPVFNTSHFLGFFSSVNSEVIKDISLYKGGIPARYGGRISSVLNIVPKDGNKKNIGGSGGISPVTSNLMIEGPVIKDKTSFIAAGRSTYSNWILKLFDETSLKNSKISFYDANIRVVHDINKDNSLELSAYTSHDAFKFNNDTLYSYNNSLFSLKWRHVFSDKLFAVFSANNSNYKYNISSKNDIINSFELLHNIKYSEINANLTWYPGYRHQVDMGLDISFYDIIPGELRPLGDSSLVVPTIIEEQRAATPALYLSDKIELTNNLTITAGFRLSSFLAYGPATVYDYHPEFSKSKATITDTTVYRKGRIFSKYLNPEVRLSANYLIGASSSVKLNYNSTTQYIHQLSNTASISPTDIWVLSNTHLKPQRGKQIAIGFYTNLFSNNIEVSLEGYYKTINDMIDFKGGAKLLLNENIETDIINTTGRAKGVELMIRKDKGRLNGWISYTYSRTELKSNSKFPDEDINSGNWFPANYDKPHDLSVILNYIFSRRFSASCTYVYSTGRPITYPIATYTYGGTDVLHYSDRNKYRIPDYSRLDLSFTISGNLRSKKLAHSKLTFAVYNVLGRDNVYSIYFKTKNRLVQGYKLSVFANAIPSISYNFKF